MKKMDFTKNDGKQKLYAPVSVVIPCFQCADTIIRAVESVILQTLPPYEIFLIDDFSNDDFKTLETLKFIKKLYSNCNIFIIEMKVNMGPGSARNNGWNQSSQPYIAFLDADDAWHPRKLEIQYSWMRDHPEVILSAHKSINAHRNIIFKIPNSYSFKKVKMYRLLLFNFLPCRSVMIKKDIKERFADGKYYAEDYLLWLTIGLNGGIIYHLNLSLAYSFKGDFHEAGLNSNIKESYKGLIEVYKIIYQKNLISFLQYSLIRFFSLIKYFRRKIILSFKH